MSNAAILRICVPVLLMFLAVIFREIDGRQFWAWGTLAYVLAALIVGIVLAEIGLRVVGPPKLRD
jgi:drug/metabolite transporter (DMT)-like permease